MTRVLIGIGAAGVLIAGGAYFFFGSQNPVVPTGTQKPATGSEIIPVVFPKREVPTGEKEYQSAQYRFSILYPQTMTAAEFAESGGATTITFEDISDPNNLKGFQVFIAPHMGEEVTVAFVQQRLGSTPQSVEEILIDGAPGLAFITSDQTLGEVREVWFAHNGFIYQAAAPRPLEALLQEALQSWRFTP